MEGVAGPSASASAAAAAPPGELGLPLAETALCFARPVGEACEIEALALALALADRRTEEEEGEGEWEG